MKKLFKWTSVFCPVILLSMVSCQASSTSTDRITPPSSGATETQEPLLVLTSTESKQYPTLIDLMSDESYLRDCRDKYPPDFADQAGFRGIYPGVTTGVEMKKILGEPDNFTETSGGGVFGYSNFNGSISVNKLIVDRITMDPRRQGLTSLQMILETYGCPDVLISRALSEDPSETSVVFNETSLWYINAGVFVTFEAYPIKYSEVPTTLGYAPPSDLSAEIVFDERSKPTSFSEAVVEE